jgi:hypothetical protein
MDGRPPATFIQKIKKIQKNPKIQPIDRIMSKKKTPVTFIKNKKNPKEPPKFTQKIGF